MSVRGRLYYWGAYLKGMQWRRYLADATASVQEASWSQYLQEAIQHAVNHVPYYRSLGLPPHATLADFPPLTRRILRGNFDRLQSSPTTNARLPRVSSGGSTGEPIWMIHNRVSMQWDYAAEMYFLSELLRMPISHYLSRPRVAIWHTRSRSLGMPSLLNWAARILRQVTFLEPYTVSSESLLLDRLQRINRIRPIAIWSYASSLYEMARVAKRRNVRVHRPQIIISSAEMLYPEMRQTIEEVFGCPVRNCYGAVEVRRVAAECSHGRIHLLLFNAHAEVLDPEGRSVKPGEEGRLVVTPLHNRAMPLIRYEIGDMARLGTEECPCGNPLPVLDGITGRVIDHFVTADNTIVHGGYFASIFLAHEWISEYQVLQQDIDLIKAYFKTMPGREAPPHAFEQLNAAIRSAMGSSCRIEWHEVDTVPRTPIGKLLHTRSLVWEERQRHDR